MILDDLEPRMRAQSSGQTSVGPVNLLYLDTQPELIGCDGSTKKCEEDEKTHGESIWKIIQMYAKSLFLREKGKQGDEKLMGPEGLYTRVH